LAAAKMNMVSSSDYRIESQQNRGNVLNWNNNNAVRAEELKKLKTLSQEEYFNGSGWF